MLNFAKFSLLGFVLLLGIQPEFRENKFSLHHRAYALDDSLVIDSVRTIKVISAGDAMAHLPQITSAYNAKSDSYDFHSVFAYINPLLHKYDLRIVNFETTCGGKPYTGYPQFSAPDTLAYALKDAGFNFFVSANNHSVDRGKSGIVKTIDVFEKYNIDYTGTFKDLQQRDTVYPFIWEKDSIRIAILNYTYGTNGLPVPKPTIVNLIDTIQIRKDIEIARTKQIDLVIVSMHWGAEYLREPDSYQRVMADFLLKQGVDIIIGSHPHVVQPIELKSITYKGKPKKSLLIWSLGNFVSNQQRQYTDGGIFVSFDIEKHLKKDSISIKNIKYIPFWVYRTYEPYKYYVLPVALFENNDTIFNFSKDKIALMSTFARETRVHLKRDTINITEQGLIND